MSDTLNRVELAVRGAADLLEGDKGHASKVVREVLIDLARRLENFDSYITTHEVFQELEELRRKQ